MSEPNDTNDIDMDRSDAAAQRQAAMDLLHFTYQHPLVDWQQSGMDVDQTGQQADNGTAEPATGESPDDAGTSAMDVDEDDVEAANVLLNMRNAPITESAPTGESADNASTSEMDVDEDDDVVEAANILLSIQSAPTTLPHGVDRSRFSNSPQRYLVPTSFPLQGEDLWGEENVQIDVPVKNAKGEITRTKRVQMPTPIANDKFSVPPYTNTQLRDSAERLLGVAATRGDREVAHALNTTERDARRQVTAAAKAVAKSKGVSANVIKKEIDRQRMNTNDGFEALEGTTMAGESTRVAATQYTITLPTPFLGIWHATVEGNREEFDLQQCVLALEKREDAATAAAAPATTTTQQTGGEAETPAQQVDEEVTKEEPAIQEDASDEEL